MAEKDFQALQDLVALIRNGKVRVNDILHPTEEAGRTKVGELFEGIGTQQFASDEAAAKHFYNSEKTGSGYQKLRQTLYQRLLTTLFLLETDQTGLSDRQQAYQECNKDWAAARILLGRHASLSGIRICEKVLQKAIRFEFIELVLLITRVLRAHYGIQEADSKKFAKYHKLFQEYQQIWMYEGEAEELYTDLVLRQTKSKGNRKDLLRRAKTYYTRLQPGLKTYNSYTLQLCGGLIKLMIAAGTADTAATLEACEDLVNRFEKKPYKAAVPLQVAFYQQLICHTQLKQYREGKRAAEKCLALLPEGSFNWFKYQELYLIFLFHVQKYQEAYDVFLRTVAHNKFKQLSPAIQETWKIMEGWLYYLIERGRIRQQRQETHFTKFRLGRFLNETPIYSQDKRGMNIPILILQILFLIQEGKYESVADRIEAIEKYVSRYLRKDDTYRSNCFIKMLLEMPKAGFHRAAVIRKAARHRDRLEAMPLSLTNQAHEIEIIPYEDLWQLALDSLDHQFH